MIMLLRVSFFICIMCLCLSFSKITSIEEKKYIIEMSWNDVSHGIVSYQWILGAENSQFAPDHFSRDLVPLKPPRYFDEYLNCSINKGVDVYVDSLDKKFFDSAKKRKINKLYDINYDSNNTLKIKNNRSFRYIIDTLNRVYTVRIFKVVGTFYKCKAANNNLGSSFTDTIAMVGKINRYIRLTKKEKMNLKEYFISNKEARQIFSLTDLKE